MPFMIDHENLRSKLFLRENSSLEFLHSNFLAFRIFFKIYGKFQNLLKKFLKIFVSLIHVCSRATHAIKIRKQNRKISQKKEKKIGKIQIFGKHLCSILHAYFHALIFMNIRVFLHVQFRYYMKF